jgi:hypothetical protein
MRSEDVGHWMVVAGIAALVVIRAMQFRKWRSEQRKMMARLDELRGRLNAK